MFQISNKKWNAPPFPKSLNIKIITKTQFQKKESPIYNN